jgi:molybdate transport system ATP-binding protein
MALTFSIIKSLGRRPPEAPFTLEVEGRLAAGCTVVLGPSGSGKTTMLRCLAGLERPDSGTIHFGDETWVDAARGIHVPPQRRKVGMLFNDYALFPRMTVRANVAYAGADAHRVAAMLERFELSALAESLPARLSAGQQQRVALARTMMADPRLLLLDEPFSALDASLRHRLQDFLLPMLRELGVPVLWVTHDLDEACRVGDTLLLMDRGRAIRTGAPRDLLERPGTPRAAEILGVSNRFTGRLQAPGVLQWGSWILQVPPGPRYTTWGIRAERVLAGKAAESCPNRLNATLRSVHATPRGLWFRAEVEGGGVIEGLQGYRDEEALELTEGAPVVLGLPPAAIFPLEELPATHEALSVRG